MRAEEGGAEPPVRLACQADCWLVIEDGYIAPRIYSLPIQKLTPDKARRNALAGEKLNQLHSRRWKQMLK